MTKHAKLNRIRLELARTDGFPEGSNRHGYEFVAPLDGKGHIDPRNRKTRSVAAPVRGWPFFEVDQCCY